MMRLIMTITMILEILTLSSIGTRLVPKKDRFWKIFIELFSNLPFNQGSSNSRCSVCSLSVFGGPCNELRPEIRSEPLKRQRRIADCCLYLQLIADCWYSFKCNCTACHIYRSAKTVIFNLYY